MPVRFVANTPISGPIRIAARPDVDLNGVMFSYEVGLMYPPQQALEVTMRPPTPAIDPQNNTARQAL